MQNECFYLVPVLENRNKKKEYKYADWKVVSPILLFLLSRDNSGLGFQPRKMRAY